MYHNPHAAGYEVFRSTSTYSADSHGDLSSITPHLITNDFPDYAGMFYQPTQHEQIASIKYSQVNPGYDSGLREFQESLQGMPFEFYIPQSFHADDGIGRADSAVELTNPFREMSEKLNKGIINEIQKAQEQVKGKQLVMRDVEIEDTFILRKRKIRAREIFFRNKK